MKTLLTAILSATLVALSAGWALAAPQSPKIRVIIDSDANNELDDQHAIAYTLFNGDVFHVEGVTVNRTRSGGPVANHRKEAQRVVKLCGLEDEINVFAGADGDFDEIKNKVGEAQFDGSEAVNFIIERAHAATGGKLVLIPVGKLTNIALALKKDPSIASKVRIVWLGSNYPAPGEYNQDNDLASVNYVLNCDVPFEIALVRYGKPSGTDAVRASLEEIKQKMPGLGPRIADGVTGRHGGTFYTFGDYSVNLFVKMGHQSRALFDMAAVAIVKNPAWASRATIPAPILDGRKWRERPDNPRKITLWENFDRDAIMADFYKTMKNPVPAR
jgi:hypothetical protein